MTGECSDASASVAANSKHDKLAYLFGKRLSPGVRAAATARPGSLEIDAVAALELKHLARLGRRRDFKP